VTHDWRSPPSAVANLVLPGRCLPRDHGSPKVTPEWCAGVVPPSQPTLTLSVVEFVTCADAKAGTRPAAAAARKRVVLETIAVCSLGVLMRAI
jgi:hypothetical protein